METLFIADGNLSACQRLAEMFSHEGYHVVASGSIVEILREVRGHKPRVLLLSGMLNDLPSAEMIPLLKKCNQNLKIILVGDVQPAVKDRICNEARVTFHDNLNDTSGSANLLEAVRDALKGNRSEQT